MHFLNLARMTQDWDAALSSKTNTNVYLQLTVILFLLFIFEKLVFSNNFYFISLF
ncbi:MAG: hypothetical protein JWQ40_4284 [Segetibacter sp.]|nr:hypothetical protein [Segetibacter sp.]